MCTRKSLGVITCLAVLSMLVACGKDKSTGPKVETFWTARHTGQGYQLDGVCWGGAGFVAVGFTPQGTSVSLTSPDGAQWSAANSYPLAMGQMVHVVWAGTSYVAMSDPKGLSASVDGTAFTTLTAYPGANTNGIQDIAWSGDFLAAITYDHGNYVIDTTVDGIAWGRIAGTMPWESVHSLCYGGGQWLLIELGSSPRVWRSTDLHSWTLQAQLTSELRDVAWSGSFFLLVNGNFAHRSTTGETWTSATLPGNVGSAIAWAGTEWVVAGSETYRSTDGVTWSKVSGSQPYSIRDMAWNGQVLVGVDHSGRIVTATP